MSEEMEQCDNCMKMFPEQKIATHFGYCRRNIKKCNKCGEMYDINSLDEHQEEFHKKVKCQHCKRQFGSAQVDQHSKNCSEKLKFCQYCQLKVPPAEFSAHLKQCESRTKKCDMCRLPISNKQYLFHISTCKGVVQPEAVRPSKNYAEHIQDQRVRMGEQPKKQYARVNYDYKSYENKIESQPYRKKQTSTRDIDADNYRQQYKKNMDVHSRNNAHSNQPIPSSHGISKPSSNGVGGTRSRQSKEQVGSYKHIGGVRQQSGTGVRQQSGTGARHQSGTGVRQQRGTGARHQSGTGIRQQVPSNKNILYNKQPVPKVSLSQQTRGTGNVPSTGARIQREDPPKINARQIKPTSYGINPTTNVYKPSVSPSIPYQPSKPSTNSYKPSANINSGLSRNVQIPVSRPQKRKQTKQVPAWDPSNYGGYVQDDDIPQQVFSQGHYANHRNQSNNQSSNGLIDEDEQLQKAIMMSMGIGEKKKEKHKNLPKQLDNEDLMNQSFYRDMDIEKQRAIYEEAQKTQNRHKRY